MDEEYDILYDKDYVVIEYLNKYDLRNIKPIIFDDVGSSFQGVVDSVKVVEDSKDGKVSYLYATLIDDTTQSFLYAIRIGFGLSHVDWNKHVGKRFKIVLDKVRQSIKYDKNYNLYKVYIAEKKK